MPSLYIGPMKKLISSTTAESPKMIKEHERLSKVLEKGAKGGKGAKKMLAKEAKIQKTELKKMKSVAVKKSNNKK